MAFIHFRSALRGSLKACTGTTGACATNESRIRLRQREAVLLGLSGVQKARRLDSMSASWDTLKLVSTRD